MKVRIATSIVAAVAATCVGASTAEAQQPVYVQQQPQPVYVQQQPQPGTYPLGPKVIKNYQEGDAIPPGYHADTRPRLGLAIGGASIFGAAYLITAFTAATINDTKATADVNLLYIPFVGPFAQIAKTHDQGLIIGEIFDGLVQLAGATMFICGLELPRTVLVRNDIGTLSLTPMAMGRGGYGLGAVGTF